MSDILKFDGEHRWLSNFHPAVVRLDGVEYPTVENAYQAAKTLDPENRKYFETCTPGQAKKRSKELDRRPNWDRDKILFMTMLIHQKFRPGSELGSMLMATTGRIVEGNHWGDVFWGVCRGVGKNWLGEILMSHRTYLRFMAESK